MGKYWFDYPYIMSNRGRVAEMVAGHEQTRRDDAAKILNALESLEAPREDCENSGDGKEHYNMAHRVEVGGEIKNLCTKCCDRAKANGAYVRAA